MSDYKIHRSNMTQPITAWSGSTTANTTTGDYYEYISDDIYVGKPSSQEDIEKALKWYKIATETNFKTFDELHESSWERIIKPKKGDDDMRYLYEVILVNPKNDTFYTNKVIARSETSALMTVYKQYKDGFVGTDTCIPFDDLKVSCRILLEWKKKESLKKAIETIKKAVE